MDTKNKQTIATPTQLGRYATIAGAALAIPFSGNAAVISSGIQNLTTSVTGTDPDVTVNLDLNGDSVNDFSFTVSALNEKVLVTPLGTNGYAADLSNNPLPLFTPFTVDGSRNFVNSAGTLQKSFCFPKGTGKSECLEFGPWPKNGTSAFLGVQFDISGQNHYGWIEIIASTDAGVFGPPLTAASAGDPMIDIVQWAYESDPNVGITDTAPEPSSISLLALGAAGILALRKRRKFTAAK